MMDYHEDHCDPPPPRTRAGSEEHKRCIDMVKLKKILEDHKKWFSNEGGEPASLNNANLRCCPLSGVNLNNAELRNANLVGANLSRADLRNSDLRGADLREACLCDADLLGADFGGADCRDANFSGAKNIPELTAARLMACPEEGAFVGWKKCKDGIIVKLSIPADAKRSSATTRKCRAEFVDVLEVIGADEAVSLYDGGKTVYRVGERVHCNKWDDDRWNECSGGIHFFITRCEAENY